MKRNNGENFYAIRDLKMAKKILLLLDGYRAFDFEDFEWADRGVKEGKMGKRFEQEWREIREILLKLAREAGSKREFLKLALLQQALFFGGYIVSTICTLLSVIGAISFMFIPEWKEIFMKILTYAFVPLIISLILTLIGPPLIAKKITRGLEKHFEKKRRLVKNVDIQLQNIAQKIIYSIAYGIKSGRIKIKSKDYELGVFHVDYDGIRILKRPSLFRRYYIVIPNLEKFVV
jgi:hypothetical protein